MSMKSVGNTQDSYAWKMTELYVSVPFQYVSGESGDGWSGDGWSGDGA